MDMISIQKMAIFRGLDEMEVNEAVRFLHAEEKAFRKGQVIFHAGKKTSCMGLVLEGSVTIESNDLWGNRTILSHVAAGQFFAETYALLKAEPLLVDVRANEKSRILFMSMDLQNEQHPQQSGRDHHGRSHSSLIKIMRRHDPRGCAGAIFLLIFWSKAGNFFANQNYTIYSIQIRFANQYMVCFSTIFDSKALKFFRTRIFLLQREKSLSG